MPNVRNSDHAGKKPAVDHVVPGHDDRELPANPEKERDRGEPRERGETEVGRRVRAAIHHETLIVRPMFGAGASE
jgi:hypothetical protein